MIVKILPNFKLTHYKKNTGAICIGGKLMNDLYQLVAVYLEEGYYLENEPSVKKGYQNDDLLLEFKNDSSQALYEWGFKAKNIRMDSSLRFLHLISRTFIQSLSDDAELDVTHKPALMTSQMIDDLINNCPYVMGNEFVNKEWLETIWQSLVDVFLKELNAFKGIPSVYLLEKNPDLTVVGRVYFHLVEAPRTDFGFAFLATYATGSPEKTKANHVPLKHALEEYANDFEALKHLLSTINKAADKSSFINKLMANGELFSPLYLRTDEAFIILQEIPLYESCGIKCRIPDWWRKKTSSITLSVNVGDKSPSAVGFEAILDYKPSFKFGEEELSPDDIKRLLGQSEGLTLLKGKWIEIDHEKLQQLLEIYQNLDGLDDMTIGEAIRIEAGMNSLVGLDHELIEFNNGEWLNNLITQLQSPKLLSMNNPKKSFKAHLRDYQKEGFNWLLFMRQYGFGALLADDMGLGKTIQILAMLDYLKDQDIKALLILPASLIGNWQSELAKFAPDLKSTFIHSKSRDYNVEDATLFITTYGMVSKIQALHETEWDVLILDEAQAIKNPNTKQSKEIKSISSRFKIAMTGTPVENKIADLWSQFDFLNPGLLGTYKEFSKFYVGLSEGDSFQGLKDIINPFILRRLKTDKTIIQDLPDKVEVKSYVNLSKQQHVLYLKLVDDLKIKLEKSDGIQRKGLVLSAIMGIKQICNHPDQFLSQVEYNPKHSGKFSKLAEVCEPIYENKERVLIFTQFREMIEPLSLYLETIFQRPGLILHGGTPVAKRAQLVDQFNSDEYVPFMILSLKAGGVGLNLTRANHVIHFDRWWNPAVENQATDRAFRIGQKKNVMVYKFITQGSMEEKIDMMIEAKQAIADVISPSSKETWITEYSNDELINLLTLES